MLNSFYKYTLIVLRTFNTSIYLRFRIFDAIFNYLNYLKKTIEINVCSLTKIITRTCDKTLTKLAKY